MLPGRTVFAELISHVSPRKFRTCVDRYHGDYKASRFSCWDQFLCMAFAQLTYRESLRDIEACLRAVQPKLYHVGHSRTCGAVDARRRQRNARLADLCGLRPRPHHHGARALRR